MADEKAGNIVEVRGKHNVHIVIDYDRIQQAFKAVCDDAHQSAQGNASDMILLSFHQCKSTRELQQAQSLLQVLEMAQNEGCIISEEKFSLQREYDLYTGEFEGPESDKKITRDR